MLVHVIAESVDRSRGKFRASHADAAVPPCRRRAEREKQRHRRARRAERAEPGGAAEKSAAMPRHERREREPRKQDGDHFPKSRCGEKRHESEAPRNRSGDGTGRVQRVSTRRVPGDAVAAAPEQCHEERELKPRDNRGGQHHDGDDEEPPEDVRMKTDERKRAQMRREHREPIAERKWDRDGERFERARPRKRRQRAARALACDCVQRPADADAEQRDSEDQAEGESGSAEKRTEHPIPHQFHDQEREANERRRREDEFRGRSGLDLRVGLGAGRIVGRGQGARNCTRDHRHKHIDQAGSPERAAISQRLKGYESGEDCSGHRAKSIDAVEQREAAASRVFATDHAPRHRGQRAAHEHRRHADDDRGKCQASHRSQHRPERERAAHRRVKMPDQRDQEWRDRG